MPDGGRRPDHPPRPRYSAERDLYAAGRDIHITNNYAQPSADANRYPGQFPATKAIRIALALLPGENGHHRFEDLCRQVALRRIASNILPATGPVSAGGDQGRDFETFRTYIPNSPPPAPGGAGPAPDAIAFACTTQRDRLPAKFKSDIEAICTQGSPVDRIYVFSVAEVPVAMRHETEAWARERCGVEVTIIDGYGLAEMLAPAGPIRRRPGVPGHPCGDPVRAG